MTTPVPIRQILDPLATIAAAPTNVVQAAAGPAVIAPPAASLPGMLMAGTPTASGGTESSTSLDGRLGILWAAVSQLQKRRITSTTATCVVPVGTILTAGSTVEVPCTWESTPLATPTDALCFLNAGLLGAGKVTAWIKTGTVGTTGCTVIFKNTSAGAVVAAASALAGLTSITATVVGQALYTPPNIDY